MRFSFLATLTINPHTGEEIDAKITVEHHKARAGSFFEPSEAEYASFVSAQHFVAGKPSEFLTHQKESQKGLDNLAMDWLETDEGQSVSLDYIHNARERDREFWDDIRFER